MYEVEKDVPVPDSRVDGRTKYPFYNMEIGDSFFIPNVEDSQVLTVKSAAYAFRRRTQTDYKFAFRRESGGVRIWRVAASDE